MTNHPNRSVLSVILTTCATERLAAGVRRDGCGVAHIEPVINILEALARTCTDLSSSRYLRIAAERDRARITKLYCEVHDQAARGELLGDAYRSALASVRDRELALDRTEQGDSNMTTHPKRVAVAAARKAAKAAGYYVREGSYQNTADDCLGRWYIGHENESFRPYGVGYATQGDAWLAVVEHIQLQRTTS